ncbi:MAG: heavy-metal-associated domain-containing protein [Gemmatimonadota bacterium]
MKLTQRVLPSLLLAGGMILMGAPALQGQESPPVPEQSSQARAPEIVLGVDGLACPFCAYGLEKKLRRLPGVDSLEIDIDGGEVLLFVKENARVTDEELQQAVDDAGFTIREIRRAKGSDGSGNGGTAFAAFAESSTSVAAAL